MSDIQRYTVYVHSASDIDAEAHGDWVKYEDHQRIVEELKEKIADLEYQYIECPTRFCGLDYEREK